MGYKSNVGAETDCFATSAYRQIDSQWQGVAMTGWSIVVIARNEAIYVVVDGLLRIRSQW